MSVKKIGSQVLPIFLAHIMYDAKANLNYLPSVRDNHQDRRQFN